MRQAVAPTQAWIISRPWDLLLFIGSPLVAIAVLIPLAPYFPSAEFGAFLLAFFTFGHHLPGFLRTYGDPQLLQRHRTVFLLAPPIVFAIAWGFARLDLHGLLLVVFTWDIWHVLMQQYGFLRIYDAKSGRIDRWSAWGDRVLALSWYVTFIALSPHYSHNFFLRGYSTGLPTLPPEAVVSIRHGLVAISVVISVLYSGYQGVLWLRSGTVNWRKLAALACFLWATWYLYVAYPDFTVGFAVWSAFHCLQYYGIVWAFNRNRATKPDGASALLRFLFRPTAGRVLLYGGLILAYGAINWGTRYVSKGALLDLLMAFVVTSGTLHYYYDGFIWRVRDQETRQPLSIGGTAPPPAWSLLRRPVFLQAAVATCVLLVFFAVETRRPYDELRVNQQLAMSTPALPMAQRNYADVLRKSGAYEEARQAYGNAIQLNGEDADSLHGYALTLASLGRRDEAVKFFEQAAIKNPGLRSAHYNAASLLVRAGQTQRALAHFREAFPSGDELALRELEKDPAAGEVLTNIALGLLQSGKRSEAMNLLRRAVQLDPRNGPAQLNLGSLLVMMGDVPEAQVHYRAAVESGDASVRAAAEKALARLP